MFKKLIDFLLDSPTEQAPPTRYDSESIRLVADVVKAEARFKAAEDRLNASNAQDGAGEGDRHV